MPKGGAFGGLRNAGGISPGGIKQYPDAVCIACGCSPIVHTLRIACPAALGIIHPALYSDSALLYLSAEAVAGRKVQHERASQHEAVIIKPSCAHQ